MTLNSRRFETERTLPPVAPGDWVGVAANAASGRGKGRALVERLGAELVARGLHPRVAWTIDERRRMAEDARVDPTCRCLAAVGGDGTVGGLLNENPTVPITVLPAGTENLFAGHFRLNRRPADLADAILEGRSRALDLGETDGRRFALMTGIGFDAEVVSRHHAVRVGRTGRPATTHRAAYVDPVLRASLTYRFPTLRVTVDDAETIEGTTVFVFNLPRYALGLPFAPLAEGNDGLLDLVVFRDGGPWRALHYLWLVLRGRHLSRHDVHHRHARRVRIESDEAVPMQVDGDPGGALAPGPAGARSVTVLPRAAEVLAPSPASRHRRAVAGAAAKS